MVLVDARHSPPYINGSSALCVLIDVCRSFSDMVFIVKLLGSVVLLPVDFMELYNWGSILDVVFSII